MSERCIVAVRFTPAGSLRQVKKAVGGFLRYVQHRDLHPTEAPALVRPQVSGLLKYVAYRDQASARAELFGPAGMMGRGERKAFEAFVLRSLEESRPQLYRSRSGELFDRRRAVYRLIISPELASGLDLRQLTAAVVNAIEVEHDGEAVRWMAAIHRNTAHPHIHLVLAGMRETDHGFSRFDLTKPRLAAMKIAVTAEISRQRGERTPTLIRAASAGMAPAGQHDIGSASTAVPLEARPSWKRLVRNGRRTRASWVRPRQIRQSKASSPLLRLRAAARRYAWQVDQEAAEEVRRHGWEHASDSIR